MTDENILNFFGTITQPPKKQPEKTAEQWLRDAYPGLYSAEKFTS